MLSKNLGYFIFQNFEWETSEKILWDPEASKRPLSFYTPLVIPYNKFENFHGEKKNRFILLSIPTWWLSFWRIWRYDVLQYDVVSSVMRMHFRVLCYFPNFFRIYKKTVKFQLTKIFRKTKKRIMHRHGRVRNFISVLLSRWTSKTIQVSNWDSAPTQFYLSWCLRPV